MPTPPQAVTERYVSNLIHNGRNKEFDIIKLRQMEAFDGEAIVGIYYRVTVRKVGFNTEWELSGATIAQATRRCLEKHGVTFR